MYETYSIDLRGLENNSLDPSFIAILVKQLPDSARVWAVLDPKAGYTIDQVLLNNIEFMLRSFVWANSKDAKTNTNEPRPLIDFDTEPKMDPRYQWHTLEEMEQRLKEINGV